jgi:hypothetical protein
MTRRKGLVLDANILLRAVFQETDPVELGLMASAVSGPTAIPEKKP